MTTLSARIEARRAALLSERAVAEAASLLQADPENGWGVVDRAITPHIGIIHEAEARAHIAAQDPAATIARVDRELAGIDADLALLERAVKFSTYAGASPGAASWGAMADQVILPHLNARYPEDDQ